jgi:hypothetical protein
VNASQRSNNQFSNPRLQDKWLAIQAQPQSNRNTIKEKSMNTVADFPVSTVSQAEFVTVPATALPNGLVVPEFKVGKYLSGQSADGKVIITADAAPWVDINFSDSKAAAKDAGYSLITETQYLALALNIAGVAANWVSGIVGEGRMFQGLRDYSVDEVQPASAGPDDGNERRWMELSNGDRIWDVAGNAYSWVFDDIQGDETGLVAKPFSEVSPSITIAASVAPSMEKGVGWYPSAGSDWSGDALLRGGCWLSGGDAGVFRLSSGWPDLGYVVVGFRCTKQ